MKFSSRRLLGFPPASPPPASAARRARHDLARHRVGEVEGEALQLVTVVDAVGAACTVADAVGAGPGPQTNEATCGERPPDVEITDVDSRFQPPSPKIGRSTPRRRARRSRARWRSWPRPAWHRRAPPRGEPRAPRARTAALPRRRAAPASAAERLDERARRRGGRSAPPRCGRGQRPASEHASYTESILPTSRQYASCSASWREGVEADAVRLRPRHPAAAGRRERRHVEAADVGVVRRRRRVDPRLRPAPSISQKSGIGRAASGGGAAGGAPRRRRHAHASKASTCAPSHGELKLIPAWPSAKAITLGLSNQRRPPRRTAPRARARARRRRRLVEHERDQRVVDDAERRGSAARAEGPWRARVSAHASRVGDGRSSRASGVPTRRRTLQRLGPSDTAAAARPSPPSVMPRGEGRSPHRGSRRQGAHPACRVDPIGPRLGHPPALLV